MTENPNIPTGENIDFISAARELFEGGIGVTQARSTLRDDGWSFSNSTLSRIYQQFNNPTHSYIWGVPSTEIPNPEVFSTPSEESIATFTGKYRFIVSVSVTDDVTGISYSGIHAWDTDTLDTVANMIDDFINYIEESYYQGSVRVNFAQFVQAYAVE